MTTFVISVGVNSYAGNLPNLNFAVSDANKIGHLLEIRFGYETYILKDCAVTDLVCIIEEIKFRIEDGKLKDNKLIFYFAGHGGKWKGEQYLFFAKSDGKVGGRSTAGKELSLSLKELYEMVEAEGIGLISSLAIFDTCSNELDEWQPRSAYGRQKERAYAIFACRDGCSALESESLRGGVLSTVLIDAIASRSGRFYIDRDFVADLGVRIRTILQNSKSFFSEEEIQRVMPTFHPIMINGKFGLSPVVAVNQDNYEAESKLLLQMILFSCSIDSFRFYIKSVKAKIQYISHIIRFLYGNEAEWPTIFRDLGAVLKADGFSTDVLDFCERRAGSWDKKDKVSHVEPVSGSSNGKTKDVVGKYHHLSPLRDMPDENWCPEMVCIQPDTYWISACDGKEGGLRKYKLDHPLAVGIYPVTVAQYKKYLEPNRKGLTSEMISAIYQDDFPITHVSRENAERYCLLLSDEINKLRKESGKETSQTVLYRLPTEEEWEIFARAGGTMPYSYAPHPGSPKGYSEKITKEFANFGKYLHNENEPYIVRVKTFKPNYWGIYGCHGNVCEWTSSVDPHSQGMAILKGGDFHSRDIEVTASARIKGATRDSQPKFWGFRVVRVIIDEEWIKP